MTHRLLVATVLALSGTGCSPQAEKPPPVVCASCLPYTGHGNHLPPSDGEGGAAGEPGVNDTPVRLEGEVRVLNDIGALTSVVFTEPVELLVEGQDADVRGRSSGLDPFALDGVKRGAAVWAQATPSLDALRTLQPIDTREPDATGVVTTALTVVRRSELELAFNVLSMPIEPDDTQAQAILLALRGGRPAAGVRVSAPGAQVVIYADNGGFSDTAISTDASGIFLLANVPAEPWPGSAVVVSLAGTVPGSFDLRLVRGGVTLGGVGN